MTGGLVSTIIPVFNRAALVGDAIRSVLGQTYRPIEIVLVDDGSTDDTASVLSEYQRAHSECIRVLRQPNRGTGTARETGRQAVQGEFIQYLDSDDILLPRKFEWQVQALRDHPECGIAYGMTRFYRKGSPPPPEAWKRTGERLETLFPALALERWWDTSTPLYRRSVTDAVGPWSDLRVCEDWEYDSRFAAAGVRLAYVPEFVSDSLDHSGPRASRAADRRDSMRQRVRAHVAIAANVRAAHVPLDAPDMRAAARYLFLVARQCGALGLAAESRTIFDLAVEFTEPGRRQRVDFRLYRCAAGLLGWSLAGRLACALR